MRQIDKLVSALETRGFVTNIWDKHGMLRVYVHGGLGKKMASSGKVYFDYPDPDDQVAALQEADNSQDALAGSFCRVWHDSPTVRKWAYEQMAKVCTDIQREHKDADAA